MLQFLLGIGLVYYFSKGLSNYGELNGPKLAEYYYENQDMTGAYGPTGVLSADEYVRDDAERFRYQTDFTEKELQKYFGITLTDFQQNLAQKSKVPFSLLGENLDPFRLNRTQPVGMRFPERFHVV